MFKLSSTEYPPRAALLLQDVDTQRVFWLNDLVNVPKAAVTPMAIRFVFRPVASWRPCAENPV